MTVHVWKAVTHFVIADCRLWADLDVVGGSAFRGSVRVRLMPNGAEPVGGVERPTRRPGDYATFSFTNVGEAVLVSTTSFIVR